MEILCLTCANFRLCSHRYFCEFFLNQMQLQEKCFVSFTISDHQDKGCPFNTKIPVKK